MLTQQQLDALTQNVLDLAAQPKSITTDGETFSQHSLSELLQLYRLARAEAAAAAPFGGIRVGRFIAPGSTSRGAQ